MVTTSHAGSKSYEALKKWVEVMIQLAEGSIEEPQPAKPPGRADSEPAAPSEAGEPLRRRV